MCVAKQIKIFIKKNPRYEDRPHQTTEDWLEIAEDVEAVGSQAEANRALAIANLLE